MVVVSAGAPGAEVAEGKRVVHEVVVYEVKYEVAVSQVE